MRSASNGSSASSFSPTPTSTMGLPVTSRTDSAAPPRASPSALVRMTPVRSSAAPNARAEFTASWPAMASMTNRRLVRLHRALDLLHLFHELGVDVQAARGVDDQRVVHAAPCRFERVARDGRRSLLDVGREESGAHLLREALQLQHRRRAADVRAD